MLGVKVCNLIDTSTGRHHPILFRKAPGPGRSLGSRYKSMSHHTSGFDTREESLAECEVLASKVGGDVVDRDFGWDGTGVPAMVAFFS